MVQPIFLPLVMNAFASGIHAWKERQREESWGFVLL